MKRQSQNQDEIEQNSFTNNKLTKQFIVHKPKRQPKSINKSSKLKQEKQIFEPMLKKLIKKTGILSEQKILPVVKTQQKSKVNLDRQVQSICEILKYMLGQYKIEGKATYCNQYKTCEDWQIDQIMKQISDTNLGDFIIKCPNPDNVSEELQDIYGQIKEDSKPYNLNASQAMQFYYDLFQIQTASKLDSQREHVAFLLGFYFIKYTTSHEEQEVISDTFIRLYTYFKLVQTKTLVDYAAIRQEEGFYQKYQYLIEQHFALEYNDIQGFKQGRAYHANDQNAFKTLKRKIHWNMNSYILKEFQKKSEDEEMIKKIFGKIKSISQLLKTFPQLMENILEDIKKNCQKQERILFGGQYLKKTITGENVIWVNTKNRPADVTTLLRMSLLYKLVVKSKLFVRSFLSRDEQHIMLVVKTSEQILQNYAQKYKINMQVDLGASDLFSFQPVDVYLRPLRLNSYIRDNQFIQKYNIRGPAKQTEQQMQNQKSIESEAITIYKKAEVMNEDELRTKIIMDQFQADEAYKWISNKLNIDYIDQKVLVNDYNTKSPSRRTWELFYVYNKMVIQFTKRIKNLYKVNKKAKQYYLELDSNIGMVLRLMFIKALHTCNNLHYNYREMRSIIPRSLSNIWTTQNKLKNIWHYMEIQSPSGFCTYRKTKSNERLWRKFQINQLKDRSKFFPSQRLIITNKVIYDSVNLSKSLQKKHIINYYPLHDPYVLKNIQIMPYISSVKKMKKTQKRQFQIADPATINKLYSQYECPLTQSDFTKMSIEQRLAFKIGDFKSFSADGVRYYCGQKIAFYFEFMKFLAIKAFPFLLIAMIIQICLWKEQTDILANGISTMTNFNNVLIFIYTFINLFWTTNLVEKWKSEQKRLAQSYGVSELAEFQQKRVKFQGSFKRDFQTDQLNFQYVPKWKTILKTIFTIILNLAYVLLVAQVILLLFLLKTYMFQLGLNQTLVNQVPSILISIASQIFNKIYTIIIRNITIFQNHKTVSEYQGSLISKASLITFVINFYSIFIYAYFSGYLASSYICEIKTTTTLKKIQNCDYFVSSQLLSLVLVDMAVTVVGALVPLLMFKINDFMQSRKKTKTSKFSVNFFESIDQFYEEQDRMESYMFNEELDNSWMGYMKIINVFAATALFAPALPFSYAMMFIAGIIRLHASKFQVIYLKKRILPIKANSINWWLMIVEAISFISIITNIAYMIYTRQVFVQNRAKLFFLFIILFFAFKYYLLSQYSQNNNQMAKRNELKTTDLLLGRRKDKFTNIPEQINTDIQNVIYDENVLNRKFHNIKAANLKHKTKKDKTV